MPTSPVHALLFDVFGTVVDWRNTIIDEGGALNRSLALDVDWSRFADRWRSMYQPAMEQVRSGARPWTVLDELHRESLDVLVEEFGLRRLSAAERDHLNRVWHRLNPWPDSVAGLRRLKRHFIIAPLSNGNVSLLVNMAKHAGLPWDVILGAEVAGHYKPQAEAYLTAARLLGADHRRILFIHLVPGFTSHIIVVLTLAVPAMILGETALSFLGLGLRPPVVSWGVLLQDCMSMQTVATYPWLLLPVIAVILTVLAFNFLGDGLRDAADPYAAK